MSLSPETVHNLRIGFLTYDNHFPDRIVCIINTFYKEIHNVLAERDSQNNSMKGLLYNILFHFKDYFSRDEIATLKQILIQHDKENISPQLDVDGICILGLLYGAINIYIAGPDEEGNYDLANIV